MSADSKPRHWRQVVKRANPEYLYAEDIGPRESKIDVEIVDSGAGKVKNPDGAKDVIWLAFRGARKKLGLGATGCKAMAKICGTEDWAGWRGWITLVVIRTSYFDSSTGQKEDCDAIRIAPSRPRGPASGRGEPAEPGDEERREIARQEAGGKP